MVNLREKEKVMVDNMHVREREKGGWGYDQVPWEEEVKKGGGTVKLKVRKKENSTHLVSLALYGTRIGRIGHPFPLRVVNSLTMVWRRTDKLKLSK